jgi:tetratricopeptide (TPR) repeat protein
MSGKPTFWQLYKRTINKLDERHLGEALELLQELANVLGDWKLLDEVADVNSAYGLLLYYMEQGNNDPAREQQHTNFIATCYNIAEKAAQTERALVTGTSARMRSISEILKDMENLELKNITSEPCEEDANKHVELYTELFNASYDSFLWNDEAAAQAQEVIDSALIAENDKILMTSGLFINCLQAFDARKIIFFADNYSTATSSMLRIRMLVAVAFTLYTYRKRLFAYPVITSKLKDLCNNPRFTTDMQNLQKLIIESLSTHEVDRKMREEIIPAMLKSHNFNPEKFGIDSLEEISESNPEWKNFEQQVGKLAELEAAGADIYYSTFSTLKRYPFFNNAANWLYPFEENHPGIPKQIRKTGLKGIANALLKSDVLCDSDKYSFCMLTTQMTDVQVNMIISQLPEMGGYDTAIAQTSESTCRNYLRNLFRFFYLYSGKSKPANPFETDMSLLDCNELAEAFKDKTEINKISAYAIKKGKYDMAISFLLLSETKGFADSEVYQELGFCYQKKKSYFDAIAAYEKANALSGDSKWTLQHLAQTNRIVGNYKDALNYYRLLETAKREDAKIAFRCGECLVHLESYDDAMHEFFKAEYLNPDMTAATRAIAWCSILTDDIKQARKYYDKLLLKEEQGEDLLNAGHAAWIDGDTKAAVELYSRAYAELKREEFLKRMQSDKEILKTHGISNYDITFMSDIVIRKKE